MTMTAKTRNHRCKAVTVSGKPCQAAATAGGLCFFHANPNKAAELGRIGGKKNRHASNEHVDPLPNLNTALAVRETVARLIADVYAGKMNPRTAASLGPLLNLQLRAIETTDLARRLAEVEKQLSQQPADAMTNRTGVVSDQTVRSPNDQTPREEPNAPH